MKNLRTNRIAVAALCCAFLGAGLASGAELQSGALIARSASAVKPEKKTAGNFFYTTTEQGTATIVGTTSDAPDDLTIPATIDGKPVTEISGFESSETVRSVVLPEGLTTIAGNTFRNSPALRRAVVPASVTQIGIGAFADCDSLEAIEVAPENPNYRSVDGALLSKDGKQLLCPILDKDGVCVIPEGVEKIVSGMFHFRSSLTKIVLPASLSYFGNVGFCESDSLTAIEVSPENPNFSGVDGALLSKDGRTLIRSFANQDGEGVVPKGVTTIGESAFENCRSLLRVTIPSSVTTIEDVAFASCNSLNSVEISEGVTKIADYAFSGVSSLKSLKIPASVTSIGFCAFSGCNSLTFDVSEQNPAYRSINGALVTKKRGVLLYQPAPKEGVAVVPEGVASIALNAFESCNQVKRVVLPASLTSLDSFPFYSLSSLSSIEVSEKNPNFCVVDGALLTKDGKTLICSFADKDGVAIIPAGVTTIGDEAFFSCRSLKKAVIPADVTKIAPRSFSACVSATFEVSEQNPTFYSENGLLLNKRSRSLVCSRRSEDGVVVIPDGVSRVNEKTIADPRDSVCRLILPESVASVDPSAFEGCRRLTSIEVSDKNPKYCSVDGALLTKDGKTLIRSYANEDGEGVVPEGVTKIGPFAFISCSYMTSVKLPEGVTSIEYWAFANCDSLKSVSIPASLTSIDGLAFLNCESLRSLDVSPDNSSYCVVDGMVLSKDRRVLVRASVNDEGVAVVPDGVTTIADYAFIGCESLSKIVLSASVSKIADSAFFCPSLDSIEVSPDNPNYCVVDGSLLSKDRKTLVRAFANEEGVGAIPDGVTKVGVRAFAFDDTLQNLVIPASVTEIGDAAFAVCPALTSITVDENNPNYCVANGMLTSKDSRTIVCAFGQNRVFAIPEQATIVDSGAFYGQPSLTSVKIPDGMTKIGAFTFAGCVSAVNVSIPSGVTSVEDYAFLGCAALKEIVVPEGVASIGECAFADCDSLTSVVLPASVTEIASSAFFIRSNDLTIRGVPGSYAEQYAEENGIPFVDASANADDDFDVDFDM